jgi:arabinogalactan endo-1,4-beta-galactosidase
LKKALYDHTCDVVSSLAAQGTPPYMVQLGNEINSGMLWPDGHTDNWDNLAALLKEGYRAVKDCSPTSLVMLHIAEGGKNEQARWWFDNAVQRKVPFDLIGVSYYAYWHGTLADLQQNLDDITQRYDKDVIVVETAHPFTAVNKDAEPNIISDQVIPGYPFSEAGQAKMLADVMAIVRAVPGGRGLGIFYWDATWTAVPGNGWNPANPESGNAWENQALFGYEDEALPAMSLFGVP